MSTALIASIQVFLLVLFRALAVFLIAPAISARSIPSQVKIGLGVFVALALFQVQRASLAEPLPLVTLAGAALRESLIGALIGFVARLSTAVAEVAGNIMDQQTGFRSGSTMNPLTGSSSSIMEQLYFMLATLLFMVVDGHHVLLLSLVRTYDVIPLAGGVDLGSALSGERLTSLVSLVLTTGCSLALPVIAVTLVLDVALAIVSRAVPQVQVFFLGMPVKVGVALALLAVVAPTLVSVLKDTFGTIPAQIDWILGAL